jgi:hypothetical protein
MRRTMRTMETRWSTRSMMRTDQVVDEVDDEDQQ